jgi:hypothetical protein
MPRLTALVLPTLLLLLSQVTASDNPVFHELNTTGIKLSDGTVIRLPAPSLPDGLDLQTQQKILKEIAGRYPLSMFVRKSRVAPLVLKMNSVKNQAGERTGQTVDLWFVAYGRLDTVDENQLIQELGRLDKSAGPDGESAEGRELTVDELRARNIEVCERVQNREEHYAFFDGQLLNRVKLRGVTRAFITRSGQSTLAASTLDRRFADDPDFSNQWRSLTKDDRGDTVVGPPNTYDGFGAYAKATQLQYPEGAILIEIHVAFNEPSQWFGGANLLRSKLPLMIQDNVRSFRTKLGRLSE